MKTSEDFRREYPDMDEGFRCAVLRTLQDLEQEEVKPVKKKLRFGLVIVLAVMLLGTVAIAASVGQWGLNEFWNRTLHLGSRTYIQTQSNPEASHALRLMEDPPTITTPYGTITVREHAYDGIAVYLVMDVVPAEGVLLLPDNVHSIHDPIPFVPEFSHLSFSVKDFAEHLNRPDIVWFLPTSDLYFWERGHGIFHEDGSMTFMVQYMMEDWQNIQDSIAVWLNFMPYRNMVQDNITQGGPPPRRMQDYDIYREIKLDMPLEYTPPIAIAQSDTVECEALEDFSASLTMVRTHITTYCILRYAHQPAHSSYLIKYRMLLLDERGEPLTNGTWDGSIASNQQMISTVSLDRIPDVVRLGFMELVPTVESNTVATKRSDITMTFHLNPQP